MEGCQTHRSKYSVSRSFRRRLNYDRQTVPKLTKSALSIYVLYGQNWFGWLVQFEGGIGWLSDCLQAIGRLHHPPPHPAYYCMVYCSYHILQVARYISADKTRQHNYFSLLGTPHFTIACLVCEWVGFEKAAVEQTN